MAPAAAWTALAVGLQLWVAGRAVPAQVNLTPYTPEHGSACQPREYFNRVVQMCCAKCPPGQHVKQPCSQTVDTVCADCESGTYTQLWNWLSTCLSCGSRCSSDQVKIQACTPERNRVCVCKPDMFCAWSTTPDSCRQCRKLTKCSPGFGVADKRSTNGNVDCRPCAPGTFSDTWSSKDACRPHRNCSVVATPGNASMDTVCAQESSTLNSAPARGPQPLETTAAPNPTSSPTPVTTGPLLNRVRESTMGTSLPIGLIVGATALGLLLMGLVNCIILTRKRKIASCLQREAKAPHLPAEKTRGATGLEQEHLLTTAPSSSSSSLESSSSGSDQRAPPRGSRQTPASEEAREETWTGSRSSESSHSSHGTHVNVTCIVNVCSSSDHGAQCSSQASASARDPGATHPSGCQKEEQVPFSQEERPSRSKLETAETLSQSHEDKPLPLGVPDVGMKSS